MIQFVNSKNLKHCQQAKWEKQLSLNLVVRKAGLTIKHSRQLPRGSLIYYENYLFKTNTAALWFLRGNNTIEKPTQLDFSFY